MHLRVAPSAEDYQKEANLRLNQQAAFQAITRKYTATAFFTLSFAFLYFSVVPIYPSTRPYLAESSAEISFTFTQLLSSDFLVNLLAFIPIGFLASALLFQINNSWKQGFLSKLGNLSLAILFCFSVSFLAEVLQLHINFRVFSTLDILAHLAGAASGSVILLLTHLLVTKSKIDIRFPPDNRQSISRFSLILLTILYCLIAFFSYWDDLSMRSDWFEQLSGYIQVPFSAVLRGSYFDGFLNCTLAFLIFLPLGFLLSLIFKSSKPKQIALLGVLLSICAEIGQAFFGNHYPDVSTSILLFMGFVSGMGLSNIAIQYQYTRKTFQPQDPHSSF